MNKYLVLCWLMPLFTFGQSHIIFNKIYSPDTINILSPSCISTNDGYLFAGPFGSFNTLKNGFFVRKTNLYGEPEWFSSFEYGNHNIYAIGGGLLIEGHIEGTYILVGSRTYEGSGERDIVMMQFLEDGTQAWTRILEKMGTIESPYHITPTTDGGYILCGIQRSFTDHNRFYILKTDAWGNKEWDKVLHEEIKGVGATIMEAYDGGYITSGYLSDSVTQADMYVAKLDDTGTIMWENTYNSTNESDIGAYIVKWKQNKYLLTAAIRESGVKKMYIAQLSIDGTEDWYRVYEDLQDDNYIQARPLILPNGFISSTYSFSELGDYTSQIIRFDNEGNILWINTIPNLAPNEDWYLKDIDFAADGGYIFSGFNYSQQSSWVVKTDSLGNTCSYVGCDSVAVVSAAPSIQLNPYHIHLSPNPASEVVTVQYELPIDFPFGTLRLYDLQGSLVMERRLDTWLNKTTVSVLDLAAGLYVYEVDFMGRGVGSGKLVVE